MIRGILVSYLALWWFCIGCALGGLANVWIHSLTGGQWGDAIRPPLLRLARTIPVLALLFLPVLFGMHALYPWAAGADAARWAGELAKPEFKRAWLEPAFFIGRAAIYLVIWSALAVLTLQERFSRSRSFATAALLIYALTGSFAAIDWVMSLVPRWYSTSFGLLVLTGQSLAGAAYGVVAAARARAIERSVLRDLGNILLTYVLLWAYLAYTQYLVIWAENLPDEISWYLPRLHSGWWWVGWALIAFHFFLPLLVLLSRSAKGVPRAMTALAAAVLFMHFVDACWLTVPSISVAQATHG